jgi:hypothetical protein
MCTETCPRVASSIECDALATCPWRNGGCADRCELQYPNKNSASCTADSHCQINSLVNARILAASTSSRWLGRRILQARLRVINYRCTCSATCAPPRPARRRVSLAAPSARRSSTARRSRRTTAAAWHGRSERVPCGRAVSLRAPNPYCAGGFKLLLLNNGRAQILAQSYDLRWTDARRIFMVRSNGDSAPCCPPLVFLFAPCHAHALADAGSRHGRLNGGRGQRSHQLTAFRRHFYIDDDRAPRSPTPSKAFYHTQTYHTMVLCENARVCCGARLP